MAVFEYKGMTAHGKTVNGIVDADSPRMARQKLRSEGVYATDVYLEKERKRSRFSRDVSLDRLFQRPGQAPDVETGNSPRKICCCAAGSRP